MKELFLEYLRKCTRLSEKSADNYCGGIKVIDSWMKKLFPEFTSCFEFTEHSCLNKYAETLLDNSDFKKFNESSSSKNMYSGSIEWYLGFLQALELFKNNHVVKQSSIPLTEIGYSDIVLAMRTKPFLLLAGISGTGKSRIVKQMAFDSCPNIDTLRSDLTAPGNYCLIEVKPNWHDSTELLGYESKIGGEHYQLTPFVRFLAKAMLYPAVPFFVCLDEMNLAPVEQYFAEFLSVIESRTKIDGHIVSEPLIKAVVFNKYNLIKSLFFTEGKETEADQPQGTVEPRLEYGKEVEVYESLTKYGLRIPENVIVIGTVNMDETTHQFSRKVIDRAMTIEMNLPDGDPFMDFFDNGSELVYRSEPTKPSLYLATETRASDVVRTLAEDNADKTDWLKGEVASFLTSLNEALDGTPFKIAYRVQNELMLYFYQLWLENKDAKWRDILNTACDQILMMKVLPRIEGDEELLENPLKELAAFCEPFSNAQKKIKEMTGRLVQSRFTSFWP